MNQRPLTSNLLYLHTGTEYFDTEYLDKDFDEVDIVDAIKFNTKEEAEAFIVKQYTIKEVYADEN